jgi:hypothetical protein
VKSKTHYTPRNKTVPTNKRAWEILTENYMEHEAEVELQGKIKIKLYRTHDCKAKSRSNCTVRTTARPNEDQTVP